MTEKIFLFAQANMTHADLLKTLKRLRRHAKLGFYVEAEQIDTGYKWHNEWCVKLFGPKIYWKRKVRWEISNAK